MNWSHDANIKLINYKTLVRRRVYGIASYAIISILLLACALLLIACIIIIIKFSKTLHNKIECILNSY